MSSTYLRDTPSIQDVTSEKGYRVNDNVTVAKS